MEADWEFDLAADSPVIDACWPGFVDLSGHPEEAVHLPEAVAFPPLANALARLNLPGSPVWTAKCDFFPSLDPSEFDIDELDAAGDEAACACAIYLDLLPRGDGQWPRPEAIASGCKILCARIRAISLRSCRADLVIRLARAGSSCDTLGMTAYLTACGNSLSAARAKLASALEALVDSILASSLPTEA